MKNENLIHVKLEYGEALQARRDILLSEINLLRIVSIIKKYHLMKYIYFQSKFKLSIIHKYMRVSHKMVKLR